MREESQLEDMRAALRGDFERLERRRGSQGIMLVPDPPAPAEELDEESAPVEPRPSLLRRLLGR